MNLLPFGQLAPYRNRTFVSENVDWCDWNQVDALYNILERGIAEVSNAQELERWILDLSEFDAALDEHSTRLYIAMTCHTDDEEAKSAYLSFIEDIEPRVKPRKYRLAQLYAQTVFRKDLSKNRYAVYDRETLLHVELFRSENVPLQTEESKLEQEYQELAGSLTVNFQGEEKTLVQMGRYYEEPDRDLRKLAWEVVSNRRLQEKDRFDTIYDKLIKLRTQIAANAGFSNYRDYAFRAKGRFDYTPEDCLQFHAAIEEEVMPIVRLLHSERKRSLGVDLLRPWDLAVDPYNQPPLAPFATVEELIQKTERMFCRLDSGLADDFRTMRAMKLLDLENRKGKAPGGYQSTLSEARQPFIFMNSVGLQRDVETLLHESGHAFHAIATQHEEILSYRHAPIEFCEVASMSMELLASPYLDEFYSEADANRARKTHLEGIISFFPWMAIVDAFQHWVYLHPEHTREERAAVFQDLTNRFGGEVDYSGYEILRDNLWHRQLHIFLSPFYYVEYGIAQIGALQIWNNSIREQTKALQEFKVALMLGGSRTLPELFHAAGCSFTFDSATLRPLMQLIRMELDKLKI